jgi:hypothetical protein
MIHRIALITAGVVATVVLTVGLVIAGFLPVVAPAEAGPSRPASPSTAAARAAAREPEIVYVQPAAKPRPIVVTRVESAATAGRSASRPRVERSGRESEHEDGEDRDDDAGGDD